MKRQENDVKYAFKMPKNSFICVAERFQNGDLRILQALFICLLYNKPQFPVITVL